MAGWLVTRVRRGGLGRGLGALIPTGPVDVTDEPPIGGAPFAETELDRVAGLNGLAADHSTEPSPADREPLKGRAAHFREVEVDRIRPNPRQPRQVFDEDALAELTHSIREFGMLQPVVVRAVVDGYELVMGERRLRAATAAGLRVVPAIVRETADDTMLRDALLENIHRTALNPLEEAAAYGQLLEEFGVTHDELGQRIGRSRSQVTNTIRLLNLPVPVQRRVAAGVLSAGHARALLGLDDSDAQEELAARIVAEGLSVRATEEQVALADTARRPVPRRRSGPRLVAPAIEDLAGRLSDSLDTRVRVELGRRKGRITVEFASVDDLERIVALIAPHLATRSSEPSGVAQLHSVAAVPVAAGQPANEP